MKLDISTITLLRGSHAERENGVCLMEAVAWFAGLPHSDSPACTDVALAAFGRSLNDRMTDEERQLLRPLIPRLVGTKGSRALARRRAYLLVDRHLRSILPAWFRDLPNKPRPDLAARLEGLPPIVDGKSAGRARDLAREIRDEVRSTLPPGWWRSAYAAADTAAAAAYAYAAADTAYAAAYAYAAAAAADAAAYAYAAAAAADAAAYAFKSLRRATLERSVAAFVEAIDLVEESAS